MTTEEFLRDVCPNHTDTSKEKGIIIPEEPNELKNLESSKISYLHSVINANQIALKYQTERILELEEIIKDLKK